MDLIFVTGNKGKFEDAEEIFSRYGIKLVQKQADMIEPRADSPREVAIEKAQQAIKIFKKPLIVEDSGFFIDSLNGFPGVFVNHMLNTIGINGLYKLLEGKDKTCHFRAVLAYSNVDGKIKVFEHVSSGKIVMPRGKRNRWSELFKIFLPDGYSRTLGDMSATEYTKYRKVWLEHSHFKKLAEYLVKK